MSRKLQRLGFRELPSSTPSHTLIYLDSSADKIASTVYFDEAATITRVAFYTQVAAGTSPTYKVSLQGITADDDWEPDGTVLGGGSPASTTFTIGSSNLVSIITLDNSYAVSAGDRINVVIEYDSGTIDTSNRVQFGYAHNTNFWLNSLGGTNWVDTGTGWGTVSSLKQQPPALCAGSATEWYGVPAFRGSSEGLYSNGTERGSKFTVPSHINEVVMAGFSLLPLAWTDNANSTLRIYEGGDVTDTTSSYSQTIYHNNMPSNGMVLVWLDTPQVLTGGTTYRISLEPSSGTIRQYYSEFQNSSLREASIFHGCDLQITSRSGGNWTDDDLYTYWFDVFANSITYS